MSLRLAGAALLAGAWTAAGAEAPVEVTPALRLATQPAPDALRVPVGQPVRIELHMPGETWRTANIGHLGIRAAGVQHNLTRDSYEGEGGPEWSFSAPGHVLILLAAGPGSARSASDRWRRTTRCTKLIAAVEPAAGPWPAADEAGLTAKAGHRIEIVPLLSPPGLRPGSDLPVRVYFDPPAGSGAVVRALEPGGQVQIRTTDSSGVAIFRITAAGRWLISFEASADDTLYRAELVFEVR